LTIRIDAAGACPAGRESCARAAGKPVARLGVSSAWLLAALVAGPAMDACAEESAPVVCEGDDCLVAGKSAYPSLVVGEFVRVDEPRSAQRWWARAREHGAWVALPADAREFGELVRPVTIRTLDRQPSGARARTLTVLMTQLEFANEKLEPGALVRYAPHGTDHEHAPEDQPRLAAYWDITGCVLTLCSAADTPCKAAYLPGIYERASGRAADWRTGRPTSAEPLIEPVSRRPVRRDTAASGAGSP